LLKNISIDAEAPRILAEAVSAPELQLPAARFAEGANTLLHLLSLPLVLLTVGAAESARLAYFAQSLVETDNVSKWHTDDEAKVQVEKLVEKKFRDNIGKEFDPVKRAQDLLQELQRSPGVESSVRALLFAATSEAWTLFECLAKDAWTACLNGRPFELGQKSFSSISKSADDDINSKHISLGILARHQFDFRNKLGTVLAEKFDFTSVVGIKKAYKVAFEKLQWTDSNIEVLNKLEATRHLIVHNSGLADSEYHRRVNSDIAIGHRIYLDGALVSAYANSAIKSGCALLQSLDEWLNSNPQQSKPTSVVTT
jgi:hypothetical protein